MEVWVGRVKRAQELTNIRQQTAAAAALMELAPGSLYHFPSDFIRKPRLLGVWNMEVCTFNPNSEETEACGSPWRPAWST